MKGDKIMKEFYRGIVVGAFLTIVFAKYRKMKNKVEDLEDRLDNLKKGE